MDHAKIPFWKKSLLIKILFPLFVSFILIMIVIMVSISQSMRENILETGISNAKQTINQFKILRGYYTKFVVKVVKGKGDLKISFDHHQKENTIPLPATVIHDMSKLLRQSDSQGLQLRLYSAYPFPNRKNRTLDSFETESLQYFKTQSEKAFIRTEKFEGQEVVRVAIADKLVASACVTCHNSHPDTPKNDWKLNDVRGVLEVIAPIEEQLQGGNRMIRQVLFLILIIAGIVLVLLFFILKKIIKPSLHMAERVNDIAEGDLTQRFDVLSHDEVGGLAHQFNRFIEKISGVLERINSQATVLSEHSSQYLDSSVQMFANAEDVNKKTSSALKVSENATADINTAVSSADIASSNITSVAASVEQLSMNIGSIASSSEEASANMMGLTKNTDQIANDIQGISAAIKQMSSSVSEINKRTQEAVEISDKANECAKMTMDSMGKLEETSQKIGQIVKLIDNIASQTNMLALNATIEAASAGEAGKGFAVVASEVKDLAGQTAEANSKIGYQIDQIQKYILESLKQTQGINQFISEVSTINRTIAKAMEEQTSAIKETAQTTNSIAETSRESALNVQEAAIGLTEITRASAEASNATKDSARSVAEAARNMKEIAASSAEVAQGVTHTHQEVREAQNHIEQILKDTFDNQKRAEELTKISTELKHLVNFFQLDKKTIEEETTNHRYSQKALPNGSQAE